MATLRRFVDTRSAAGWGAVANAFAAGLRQLMSEWALFTAQLEHRALCGALPLQVVRRTACHAKHTCPAAPHACMGTCTMAVSGHGRCMTLCCATQQPRHIL